MARVKTLIGHVKGEKGDPGDQGIQGPVGPQGEQGEPGFAPVVTVNKSDGITSIKITDANGDHYVDIEDGADGKKGDPGEQGLQGEQGPQGEKGDPGVTFENLSYADYEAGNYDHTKQYVITDFPEEPVKSSDIVFDDSVANLGVDNPQDAIDALSALGDYTYNGLHEESIPNNTATIVDTLTLKPGTYLILGDVRWEATNTTGRRSIGIGAYNTDPKPMMGSNTIQGPSTDFTSQATIMLMKIDVETAVNLVVYQSSGSTLKTGYNALRAIKIKN